MARKRGSNQPPPAGWRDQDMTEDSDFDPNEDLVEEDSEYDPNEDLDEDNIDDEEDMDVENDGVDNEEALRAAVPESTDYHPRSGESSVSRNWLLILGILFLILGIGCGVFIYPKETQLLYMDLEESITSTYRGLLNQEPVPETFDTMDNPWERFKHKFKEEFIPKYLNAVPTSSIKVIKAAVKDVMKAHADESLLDALSPSVILILGKEGNKNVSCFSRDLERIISAAYNEGNPIRINADTIDSSGIEAAFDEVFNQRKQHLIVIDGLNKLDGKSAAHLHRYTDHGLSEYKEAIIILLGYTDQVAQLRSESSLREMDSLASDLIMKLWAQSLPGDTIAPLISRLTPSVTAVLDWDGQVTIC